MVDKFVAGKVYCYRWTYNFYVTFFILLICGRLNYARDSRNDLLVVQEKKNCGSLQYPAEHMMQDRDTEWVYSHTSSKGSNKGYAPNEECITSIIGKQGFRFTVKITMLDIDKLAQIDPKTNQPIKCHDYLKIYDGPRADNARLLTPRTGLCGRARKTIVFTTCTPYVTFEFWTDWEHDDMSGFIVLLEQNPWKKTGSTETGGPLTPGLTWSCFMKEFQDTWDKKPRVSGDKIAQPANSLGRYQKDYRSGMTCYNCDSGSVDYFRAKSCRKEKYCYLCGKIFEITRADARRVCYSQSSYMALLRTFKDKAEVTGGYLGCRQYTTYYDVTIKYCFCKTDLCNSATRRAAVLAALLTTAAFTFLSLW